MPENREAEMYSVVKRYFGDELECETVLADLPAEKKSIQLLRNLSKRNPAVVGVDSRGNIHVAEGKLLDRSGQPFEECVAQVLSLRAYALCLLSSRGLEQTPK